MTDPLQLRSREQIAGDLIRKILIESDLTDVSPGSTLATLIEGIASVEFQLQMSILKILEAANIDSLVGANLDKKSISLGISNTVGGQGRIPAVPSSGVVTVGSGFKKQASKPYAGKPAPFAGARTLYLEDASAFPATGGKLYIGRGTVDRFEGPIPYTKVENTGSYWVVTLSKPLTKNHPYTDQVILAQGGDRQIPAGTMVQIPANTSGPSVPFTTNYALLIPDGEAEGTVTVTCVQSGEAGNALAGAISEFVSKPFASATVTNKTTFVNGRSTESDEELRKRIKNYPATLSRGTKEAVLASIQGVQDANTGRTIISSTIIEPATYGDAARVYIEDGTGLEPSFSAQAYELLLKAASGQETKFQTAQVPLTPVVAIGSSTAPFKLIPGQTLTISVDGIAETFYINPDNYKSINAATAYEIVRDFNSSSNLVGFRTTNGGTKIVAFDLSGQAETMQVYEGDLQGTLGLPTSILRPIFLYKDGSILSFKGKTATLSSAPFPWNMSAQDLDSVMVAVDGVTQTFSINDKDFAAYSGASISTASLTQWAGVLSQKIAGVTFTPVGDTLVWASNKAVSPSGSLKVFNTKSDGSPATWIGPGKMWNQEAPLYDVGTTRDFQINRFTGQIELLNKPEPASTIEIGSRHTRAYIKSQKANAGLFVLAPRSDTTGSSKLVIGYDGEFEIRDSYLSLDLKLIPNFPQPVDAPHLLRLTANHIGLFQEAALGDYVLVNKSGTKLTSDVEGIYRIKSLGTNLSPVNKDTYSAVNANVVYFPNARAQSYPNSKIVTIYKAGHGLTNGALVSIFSTAPSKWGASSELVVNNANVFVKDGDSFYIHLPNQQLSVWDDIVDITTNKLLVSLPLHGFKTGSEISVLPLAPCGGVSASNLNLTKAPVTSINNNLFSVYALGASVINPNNSIDVDDYEGFISFTYLADCWIEIEVPAAKALAWKSLEGSEVSIVQDMVQLFRSSAVPQLIDFGETNVATADDIVAIFKSSTSGGAIIKQDPETLVLQSNNYKSGTCAVLAVVGNAVNVFTKGVATSIQAHTASVQSADISSGFPVVSSIVHTTDQYPNRTYLNVTPSFTDVTSIGSNTAIIKQSTSYTGSYPVGFQQRWLSGRLDGLTARIYNTTSSFPYDGVLRTSGAIKPYGLTDSVQASDPTSTKLYSNYSLKCADLPLTNNDRLVVVMDSDGVNKTVSVPLYKKATVQSIDAVTSGGRGSIVSMRLKDPDDIDSETQEPRPFFDEQSPFKNFELTDFVIQTKSVGIYSDLQGSTVPAKGFLQVFKADTYEGVCDGDWIDLKDGINTVRFEFTANGRSPTGTNVGVPFSPGVQAAGSVTLIEANPETGIKDGDTFTLNDGRNSPVTFEFDTNNSISAGRVKVALTAATKAVGYITVPGGLDSTGGVKNNDSFTLRLPDNSTQTYQILSQGAVTAGNIAVNISASSTDASSIKNQIISTINSTNANVSNGFVASAFTGNTIKIEGKAYGTASNQTISQTVTGGGFSPVNMSGGQDWPTAQQVKEAIKTAAASATLFINFSDDTANTSKLKLTNRFTGSFGNTTISQSISNSRTLTPVNFAGGVDGSTVNQVRTALINAISANSSRIKISSDEYNTSQIVLFSTHSAPENYPLGNQTLPYYSANLLGFVISNMQGGSVASPVYGKGLVVRSASFNGQTQLSTYLKYPTLPAQKLSVSHDSDATSNRNITKLSITLGSGSLVPGSTYSLGTYTVEGFWIGSLAFLRFSGDGLNGSQEYSPGNALVVGGSHAISGAYKIISSQAGMVEVVAPSFGDFNETFDASLYPLTSFPITTPTLKELATSINDYLPNNPVASAEAIGTGLDDYKVTNPSYVSQTKSRIYASTYEEACAHHAMLGKNSGRASIYSYDSSDKTLNNIKALIQSEDALFPTVNDTSSVPYTPVNEEVYLVPSNADTLSRWLNFSAASSLASVSDVTLVDSNSTLQIASRFDGSAGAVMVTGVTANSLDAAVYGNTFSKGDLSVVNILSSEARALAPGQLIKITNSQVSELYRPHRVAPLPGQETQANTSNINTFFRPETFVRYERLNDSRARLTFLRYGLGINSSGVAQSNPLPAGSAVRFLATNKAGETLPSGLVRVNSSGGILSARPGDMMYIRPSNSPFPEYLTCKSLPDNGTASAPRIHSGSPEYWGYPVVGVEDLSNIIVIAPSAGQAVGLTFNTTGPDDLVFMPAIWNEKNVRTNRSDGPRFSDLVNGGKASVLCRAIGGGMMSIFLSNSASASTDSMLLNEHSVSTDDWVILDNGFSQANRGTFRLVAHNGSNHLIVYNPEGVNEEIDLQNITNKSWTSDPVYAPRPIRILDGESVRIGDRLRIGSAVSVTLPWFPASMMGTWEVVDIGYVADKNTPNNAGAICPFVDISIDQPPTDIADADGNTIDTFTLGSNVTAIGFVEKEPFSGFRLFIGSEVSPINSELSDSFFAPSLSNHKITEVYGSSISALYKLGFKSNNEQGVDGYKVYTGLIAQAHKIIDGSSTNNVLYPGVRAAGTKIEVLPPLIKAIGITLAVAPKDGVSLDAISPVVKANVSSYINGLGVGRPVVISEIIKVVKSLPGVFSVNVVSSLPPVSSLTPDRIVVGDVEKAIVLDSTADIVVG
jgi:hypothetical protein